MLNYNTLAIVSSVFVSVYLETKQNYIFGNNVKLIFAVTAISESQYDFAMSKIKSYNRFVVFFLYSNIYRIF